MRPSETSSRAPATLEERRPGTAARLTPRADRRPPTRGGKRSGRRARRRQAVGTAALSLVASTVLIWLVAAHGAGSLAAPLPAAALVLGSALVALVPVRIPALRIDVNATQPFVLCAAAAAGPLAAVAADVAGVLTSAYGRQRRPAALHLAYNVAAVVICSAAAWSAYASIVSWAPETSGAHLLGLLAAGAVHYAVNVGLVALALAWELGASVRTRIRGTLSWTAAPAFASVPAAALMLAAISFSPLLSVAVGVVAAWLLVLPNSLRARSRR